MEKVIKDGKVAVLISRGYGAGWYSWHGKKELLFHPAIVEMVEKGQHELITEQFCKELLGIDEKEYLCTIGVDGLSVVWIPEGTAFEIDEYDGAESIKTRDDLTLTT